MSEQQLTPRQIVHELDRFIVGQDEAKKAVAIALRNRYRRSRVDSELRDDLNSNMNLLPELLYVLETDKHNSDPK